MFLKFRNFNFFYFVLIFFFLGLGLLVLKMILQKEVWLVVEARSVAGEWWWQTPNPPAWLSNQIEVGDKELDGRGQPIAEIISVEKFGTTQNQKDQSQKEFIFKAKLRVSYNKISQKYQFKYQTLQAATPIILELPKARINALVTKIYQEEPSMEEKILILKLYGRYPWFAEAIPENLEFKDSEKTVAKILEKTVELAEITVTTDQGVVLARRDPLKRDITLKLKASLKKEAEEYFFPDGQLVKIGEKLNLKSEKINLYEAYITSLN